MSDAFQQTQHQVQTWIENVTGQPFSGSFAEHLKNGVVLCNFINGLRPNTILTINKYNAAFRQMQNIDNVLTVMSKLGVADADKFKSEDLHYENNIPKVVLGLAAFAVATEGKFSQSSGVSASGLDELREYASSSHKTDGKVRPVDSGLSLFESGMKKFQIEASNVNRTNDRLVKKDMQEHQGTELTFAEADRQSKQAMISGAKMSGQDLIIRSKDVAVASSELMFAEADRQSKQAMISDAKGRHMDNIIRSKDTAAVSSELGYIDSHHSAHQNLISTANSEKLDHIIHQGDAGGDVNFDD